LRSHRQGGNDIVVLAKEELVYQTKGEGKMQKLGRGENGSGKSPHFNSGAYPPEKKEKFKSPETKRWGF